MSLKRAAWGRNESGSQIGGGLSEKERRAGDNFEWFCRMQGQRNGVTHTVGVCVKDRA